MKPRRLTFCLLPVFLGITLGILWVLSVRPAPAAPAVRNCVSGDHSGAISADQTWCIEDAPHRVTGEVTINSGVALTIEAGVEVRFVGVGLTVNGSLVAVGKDSEPVVFTSDAATPAPDDWTRIQLNSGSVARLDYCEIGYAGAGVSSAVEIYASDVILDHCNIHDNAGSVSAVRFLSVGSAPIIRNTGFVANTGYPIYQTHIDMAPRYTNLAFTGNTTNAIYIHQGYSGQITRSVTWDGGELNGSPIIADNIYIASDGQLTLGAGTTLRLVTNALVVVYSGGTLHAAGEPGNPVTITSLDGSNTIGRLQFTAGSHATLQYCDISRVSSDQAYSLVIGSSDILVDHCNIHHNASHNGAVHLDGQGITPILRHSTIQNNTGYAIDQSPVDMAPIHQDLTLSWNGVDAVHIFGGGTFASTLQRPATWDGAALHGKPFIAEGAQVDAGGWLTLTAGTTLRLTSSAQLVVNTGGYLTALGEPAQPITITALNTSSSMNGVRFHSGSHASLAYCDISRVSSSQFYAVEIYSSDVLIDHCNIHDNQASLGAVRLNGKGLSPTLRHTTIQDNSGYAIYENPLDMAPILEDLTLRGNTTDAVYLYSWSTLDRAVTWDGPNQVNGSPFIADSINISASGALTLAANTTLRLTSNGQIDVQNGGHLTVAGAETQPVIITSLDAASTMRNIAFLPGSHASLAYCDISRVSSSDFYAVEIYSSDVLIDHCKLHDNSSSNGVLRLFNAGLSPTIQYTTIQNNVGNAIYHNTMDMAPIYRHLTVSNNDVNAIVSPGGVLGTSRYWQYGQAGLPVHFMGSLTVPLNLYLSLEPGTLAKFASDTSLTVNGSLYLLGTPTEGITLTSIAETPGSWRGVWINSSGRSIMEYCELANGGQSSQPLLYTASKNVSMLNCQVHDSANDGVKVANNAQPVFGYNRVENNSFGMRTTTPATVVDARNIWWGDASGPYHAVSNPSGLGNAASDGILFNPWLASPQYSEDPPVNEIVIDLAGPQRVSPGQTVDYAIWYTNLTQETVEDAVLVLAAPYNASLLSSTGGGIEWPSRKQVFWKLGDLPPGAHGSLTVRMRYRWGIPDLTVDAVHAMLVGGNLPHPPLVHQDYLDYEPLYVVQKTPLNQAQFDAQRALTPDLETLYQELLSRGFGGEIYSQLQLNTSQQALQAIFTTSDARSVAYLVRQGDQVLVYLFSNDSMTLLTTQGSMTMTLPSAGPVETYDWPSLRSSLVVKGDLSDYDCLFNCAFENVGLSLLGEFMGNLGKVQNIPPCITYLATGDPGARNSCLLGIIELFPGAGTLMEAIDCYQDFKADPNSCKCTDTKWGPEKVGGIDSCSRTPCNTERGIYEASQIEYFFCAFCQSCIGGVGGSSDPWSHCKQCNETPPQQCQQTTTFRYTFPPQSAAGRNLPAENPPPADCRKNCILIPRDPNAKYGPEGDLTPGQWVTYTITYENEGLGRAYGVYVLDTLSEHFDDSTLVLNDPGAYLAPTRTILWSVGELGPKGDPDSKGSLSFRVQLKTGLPGGTIIANQAVVHFPSVPEVTPTNTWINVIQPVAAWPQKLETTYLAPLPITLEGWDAGGAPLTFQIDRPPLYGLLTGSSPNITYTPAENFTGLDFFTFIADNGTAQSRPAEIQIQVQPSASDTTPPEVLWTLPADTATGVYYNRTPLYTDASGSVYAPFLTIQFSEAISETTLAPSAITLVDSGGHPAPLRLSYNALTFALILQPAEPLKNFTLYTATLAATVRDLMGNYLPAPFTWSFTTADYYLYFYLPQIFRH